MVIFAINGITCLIKNTNINKYITIIQIYNIISINIMQ